jgi:hypothetical protein
MNKPFVVMKQEFEESVYSIIKTSKLDMTIIDMILSQISMNIHNIAKEDSDRQVNNWQQYLSEMAKAAEKEKTEEVVDVEESIPE